MHALTLTGGTSSIMVSHGDDAFAFLKISLIAFSDSPTHFDRISGPLTRIIFPPLSVAKALAKIVLPHPGGPYNKTPLGASIPNFSNISGSIKNQMFTGKVKLNDLNLSNFDRLFLNTSRIKGKINLSLDISEPVNLKNIKNISGNIDGDINVNITEEEFALVLFIQSLSQDIEDFEQINELLNTLANSFINQSSSISGQISNNNLNELKIKNLILTSPDGETLEAELELALNNFKITIFDIIDNEDFVIKYQNGNYSYERVIPDGTVKKPIEDLIQKNINKLFENLFQ